MFFYLKEFEMLNNLNNVPKIERSAAFCEFHCIISSRIQFIFNQNQFRIDKRMADKLYDKLIKGHVVKDLHKMKKPNEWVIFIDALMPHCQPNCVEAIILAQLPKGVDFSTFGGIRLANLRSQLPS